LKINNSDGGDIGLILGRGSNADWRLFGSNGNLYIQSNYTSSKQTSFYSVLTLAYNSGDATVKGSVTASQMNSEKFAITSGSTVKATYQYNSTDDCVELVWA
jgi:hypothetical protein